MLPFSHGALLDLDFLRNGIPSFTFLTLKSPSQSNGLLASPIDSCHNVFFKVYNPQQSQSWLYVFSSLVFGNGEHSACRNLNCWCHALSLLHLSHGVQFRPILNILCIVVCSGFVTLPVLLKSAGYNS
ncbi:hypothetical protein V6N13_134709 [Hibiscus sabdariffa]